MTGRKRIPIDGVYTHKRYNSFVGHRATLYKQFRLYSSWYRTLNLFSSGEHCCHCVIEPSVVCCQSQSIFQHYNLYSNCFYKRQQKVHVFARRMTDWYRSGGNIIIDVVFLTALPLYQCRSMVLLM